MLAGGSRIGPYEVLASLGKGGMGEVYRARDTRLGREVAIKVLSARSDARSRGRFEREAQLASAVSHPNVLALHDLGEHEGQPYLVTELLQGRTLRELLASGPVPWRQVLQLALQIADGLSAAHEKGIVHRDLKPENLFLTRNGQVKILDFGIARMVAPDGDAPAPTLTATGQTPGTPAYMSPEQLRAERVDARSDVFSLGCVLYELLAGRRPFAAATAVDFAVEILQRNPAPLPSGIPASLGDLVLRCLRKTAGDRFQTAAGLAAALRGSATALEGAAAGAALPVPAALEPAGAHQAAATPAAAGTAEARPPPLRTLVAELKRRRVLGALVAWGAAAFAILQVIEPIMHGLRWPDAVLGWVVIALGAGFPVVVALAWAFELDAGRIQRTAPISAPGTEGLRGPRLWLALASIGLLAASPGLAWLWLRPVPEQKAGAPAPAISIAVLPLANLSDDRSQEYFADGVTQELISKLSRLPGLKVAGRTQVMRFKGATDSTEKIAAALNVTWLLEGTVRRAGDRVLISTALLKADGFKTWSEEFDGKLDDIFAMQQAIATKTVDALALKLSPRDRDSLAIWGTRNAAAYDEFLQGREILLAFSGTRRQMEAAKAHFERARAIDPGFPPALASLATCEAVLVREFQDPRADLDRAEALAAQALAADPRLLLAKTARAWTLFARYDYPGMESAARAMLEQDPEFPPAWDSLGLALLNQEPPRLDEAIAAIETSLRLLPTFAAARAHLAIAHAKAGRPAEARRAIVKLEERMPDSLFVAFARFWIALAEHQPREALARLEAFAAVDQRPLTALESSWAALALGQAGELDQAFARLEAALAGGFRDAAGLRGSPWFEPLRRDARFQPLLARHGLPR